MSNKTIKNTNREYTRIEKLNMYIYSISIFLFFFLFYSLIAPVTVSNYGDNGEMLTAIYTNGNPHQPGYPLYMLLGRVWLILLKNIPWSEAYKVNILSALFSSITLSLIFLLVYIYYRQRVQNSKNVILSILLTIFGLGFSLYYAIYSSVAEVFALNNLLIVLLIFISVLLFNTFERDENRRKYIRISFYILIFAVIFSAMIANQQESIVVFPPILFFLLVGWIKNIPKNKRTKLFIIYLIEFILLVSILVSLIYMYLFILSNSNSPVGWGSINSIHSLVNDFFRNDYKRNTTSGVLSSYIGTFPIQNSFIEIYHFLIYLLQDFNIFFVFSFAGLIIALFFKEQINNSVFKNTKKNSIFKYIYNRGFEILVISNFFVSDVLVGGYFPVNYTTENGTASLYTDIAIKMRLYIQGEIFFGIMSFFTISYILNKFNDPKQIGVIKNNNKTKYFSFFNMLSLKNSMKYISITVLILSVPVLFIFNIREEYNRNFTFLGDSSKYILNSLPKNSIMICFNDTACFPMFYEHYVENVAPDITLIPLSITEYEHYFNSSKYPGLLTSKSLDDTSVLKYMIAKNIDTRNIYLYFPDQTDLQNIGVYGNPYFTVPYGYTLKVVVNPQINKTELASSLKNISNINAMLKGVNPYIIDMNKVSLYTDFETEDIFFAKVLTDEGLKQYSHDFLNEYDSIRLKSIYLSTGSLTEKYINEYTSNYIVHVYSYNDYISMANSNYSMGDYKTALGYYESAYLLNLNSSVAFNGVINTYRAMNEWNNASTFYRNNINN